MNQEFLTNLPSEIFINIFSRLPIPTIVQCKCVCKSWLNLLETCEFTESHLSKSAPGLAVFESETSTINYLYTIYEFEDVLELEHHELHYNQVTTFILPYPGQLAGSANGLLLLRELQQSGPGGLCICNPVTRDYIQLHCPQDFVYKYPQVVTYGFGASKITRQHKVVRIFHDCIIEENPYQLLSIPRSECQVYTLGTGSWRRIKPGAPFNYSCRTIGAFLNGNLHWLVDDLKGNWLVSCFDLETELFSTFNVPLPMHERSLLGLFPLGDCLCLSDNSSDNEIVIWLMKEYGVEKSWIKEYVISKSPNHVGESYEVIRPIKIFKVGDILMAWQEFSLFYYSNKTKTITHIDNTNGSFPHTSSFLSLASFAMENVESY